MLRLEIKLEKYQNKLIQRRKMLKLNMKRAHRNTRLDSESKAKFNRKISPSSRTSIRRSKMSIKGKWLT